jgi:hypothetical protein
MKSLWVVYSASSWKGWKWQIKQPYRIFQNCERGQKAVERMNMNSTNVKHKLVEYRDSWNLDGKDSEALVNALLNPPEPSERMKAAVVQVQDAPENGTQRN